jgi:TRAP transporter TAXI family solute receptor
MNENTSASMQAPKTPRKRKFDHHALVIGVSAFILIVSALAVTLLLMRPAPPKALTMATGSGDEAYHAFALQYRDILARDGVTVNLQPSAGAVDNLRRLADRSAEVDVAFVQGGVASTEPAEKLQGLASLGSLYYQVLWVFYRGEREIDNLLPLAGKMIAIGREKSGTAALAMTLLESNGIARPPTTILKVGGQAAANLLISGGIDAAFFVADANTPVIQQLLRAQGLRLLSFARADAYTRQHFYLTKLVLPQGTIDLKQNLPARDVVLLGTTANLVVKDDLHPALAYLLLRAATQVHDAPSPFSALRQFPAPNDSELPLSREAARFYKSGPPLLQRYLPYWAANLVDRLLVLLVPALAVLFPAFKLLPPLYRWRMRSRIYRWYGKLKEIELELEDQRSEAELAEMLQRLDNIEGAVNHLDTPLAYFENRYAFRQHIDLVRQRARMRMKVPPAKQTNPTERTRDGAHA